MILLCGVVIYMILCYKYALYLSQYFNSLVLVLNKVTPLKSEFYCMTTVLCLENTALTILLSDLRQKQFGISVHLDAEI